MTKKLLVSFDPNRPEAKSGDFLAPVCDGERPRFLGLESGKLHDYGLVVFVHREVTVNDVFARLVDTGRKIDSADRVLAELGAYLEMFRDYRIGDVLELRATPGGSVGFTLSKTDMKARGPRTKLP